MESGLIIIWIIFFFLFLVLSGWHLHQAMQKMPHIHVGPRPMQREGSVVHVQIEIAGSPLDQPLQDFADEFNTYLDRQNHSSRNANRLSALGYGLAALTSAVSALAQLCG